MKSFKRGDKVVYLWEHYTNTVNHFTRHKIGLFVKHIKHRKPINQLCYVQFPKNKRRSRLAEERLFLPNEIFKEQLDFSKE